MAKKKQPTNPFEILEAAEGTSPHDSDDLVVIRSAIAARFSEEYENDPIGDEILEAIWEFIDRE